MSKIIDISNKLSNEYTAILVNGKTYQVKSSVKNIMKMQELANTGNIEDVIKLIRMMLGEENCKDLLFEDMSYNDLQVYIVAITAAVRNIEYDEAEKIIKNNMPM